MVQLCVISVWKKNMQQWYVDEIYVRMVCGIVENDPIHGKEVVGKNPLRWGIVHNSGELTIRGGELTIRVGKRLDRESS